jgi:RNA polymerase sigma-70 factor (ECF subfamily)
LLKGQIMNAHRAAEDRRANLAMARHLGGDAGAFDDLCRVLAPRLHRFFSRRTGSDDVASDLVQETLLRVFAARARFVPGAEVSPWVFCIARRVWIDRARRASFESKLLDTGRDDDGESMRAPDALPDAVLAARQLAFRVLGALSKLPALQREALELLAADGLSNDEAAARLGTTSCAVRLRALRAREAIRADLAAAA